jgi:hypothetical protein
MADAFAAALPKAPSVSPDRTWWLFPLEGCCGDATPQPHGDRANAIFAYTVGSAPVDFRTGGDGVLYDAAGWADPESWGTWSLGTHAKLRVRFDPVPAGALALALDTRMLLSPAVPRREVAISANGQHVAEAVYTLTTAAQTLHVDLPAGTVATDGVLELDFETTPPTSPRAAGVSDDGRVLGVGLVTLTIAAERAP